MSKILVLGASGQIARHVIAMMAADSSSSLTLFARNGGRIAPPPANARIVEGDVLNSAQLDGVMAGQDIVYANLTGSNLDDQAKSVVAAMQKAGVKRLIFVLSLGIYDEVPGKFGEWNNAIIGEELKPFSRAADAIAASGLDYTILRPAWLTDADEVDYETTTRSEAFKGTEVSRKSVADYIVRTLRDPARDIGGNIGLNKPGSDGDKPAFI